jgi:hypothetical protein
MIHYTQTLYVEWEKFDAVVKLICENSLLLSLDETRLKSIPFFRVLKVDERYLSIKTNIIQKQSEQWFQLHIKHIWYKINMQIRAFGTRKWNAGI